MLQRRLVVGYASFACLVLASRCGGDSNGSDAGPDGGDATTQPDVSSDAPPSDGTMTSDAASDAGDGGTIQLACAPSVRVDTLAGVNGAVSPALEAAAFGSKYVVTWVQIPQVSGDNNGHLKARAWNGTAFGAEIDLGVTFGDMRFAADGAGFAFEQWSGASTMRAVFDFSTLTFATATPFGNFGNNTQMDIASDGPGSALSAYVQTNGNFAADRFADGGWTTTGLATAAGVSEEPRLISNAAKAVFGWYTSSSTFHAVTFDGGAWSAAAQVTEGDAGEEVAEQFVVLSNGDAIYMFKHPNAVTAARFDATAGTFGAPVVVETQPNVSTDPSARHLVVVDSSDRVTIGWTRMVSSANHAFVSRSFDKGATWSTPADLGAADSLVMAVDPASSAVVVATRVSSSNAGILLHGTTATGTTWSAPVATQLQTDITGNYLQIDHNARVVFTSAGVVLVAHQRDADAGVGYSIRSVTCTL